MWVRLKNVQSLLEELGSTTLKSSAKMTELIRRPELTYMDLAPTIQRDQSMIWMFRNR